MVRTQTDVLRDLVVLLPQTISTVEKTDKKLAEELDVLLREARTQLPKEPQ